MLNLKVRSADLRAGVLGLALVFVCLLPCTSPAANAEGAAGTEAGSVPFAGCGTLIQGTECVLFRADGDGTYTLQTLGGFGLGSHVRVSGDLTSPCLTFCSATRGCIRNNTIELCVDRPPVIEAPESVVAIEGSPVSFDVSASDPDGDFVTSLTADLSALPPGNNARFVFDPLQGAMVFTWTPVSGDGRADPYGIVFTATARGLQGSGTTSIRVDVPATVDLEPGVLNARDLARWVTAFVELPVRFDPTTIDVSSLRLDGTAEASPKFAILGDHDGDGIPDLMTKFDRSALTGLAPGIRTLPLTGALLSGVHFDGSASLRVLDPATPPVGRLAASLQSAPGRVPVVLSVPVLGTQGVAVSIFDIQGRAVRTWVAPPGQARLVWDGTRQSGARVPSGVYLLRLRAGAREGTAKVAIAR